MSGMHSGQEITFLCDQNLGRLAKWLRMMGYDAEFMKSWDEDKIAEALLKGRVFLTRNRKMKAHKNCTIIQHDHLKEQLLSIIKSYNLRKYAKPFTRCVICNKNLYNVKPEEVKSSIPEYIYTTHEEFAKCPLCSRIYWRGSHQNKSMNTIDTIFTS